MIGLILTLAVIGVLVWLVENYLPMPMPFKVAIRVIVVVVLVWYVVRVFGLEIPIPRR